MEIVLGVAVLAFLAFLLIGRLTGRVTVESCCTLAARTSARPTEPDTTSQ